MRRLYLVLLCLAVLLLSAASAQARPSFNKAVDRLFAKGYPQAIDTYLYRLPGTNAALGFRWAGTKPDNQSAFYIAKKMRRMGLKNVHLEKVPVDVFDFKSASVSVGGHKMVASTFAGIRPTAAGGLNGRVVYVHNGTAADFAAAGNVTGKLVVVDSDFQDWWLNFPGAEATARGAIGVIMTSGPDSAPWYKVSPTALGSNDGEYTYADVPMVYISAKDGAWLKKRIKAGTVQANMKLIETVRLAKDGGFGYNVFGDLPGTDQDGTFVLFGAHHDVHFHAATDDSASVAANLAIAKAMKLSGYHPKHTVRFMFTTGEEFGYTDSWWDWSIGAWYCITQQHPEWAGQIRGFLNSDYFSGKGSKLKMGTERELAPFLASSAAKSKKWLPYGSAIDTPITTWQDGWTFTAAGVPSVVFAATKGSVGYTDPIYHTNYMKPGLIEWPYLAKISKFMGLLQKRMNTGLAPYDFKARARDLAKTVVPADLKTAGADAGKVDALQAAVTAFQASAGAFQARRGSIPAANVAAVNTGLRAVEKAIGTGFTALDAWDSQVYPHQQVLSDVQYLNAAITDLEASTPGAKDARTRNALKQLSNVALTGYGLWLSPDVYKAELARRTPTYYRADWGAQGHLIDYLNVIPEMTDISSGDWKHNTIVSLRNMAKSDTNDLEKRIDDMTTVLTSVTTQLNSLH